MFVALVTQHAKRMHRFILPTVVCPALLYFPTLSDKRHDFLKKKNVTEFKRCTVIFSASFVWNIYQYKKNETRYYHKCTYVFMLRTRHFCRILIKLKLSRHIFEKIVKCKISWKSVQCGPRNGLELTLFRNSSKLRNVPYMKNLSSLVCQQKQDPHT